MSAGYGSVLRVVLIVGATRALVGAADDPKALLLEADAAAKGREQADAVALYRKADAAGGGNCTECKVRLAGVYVKIRDYKNAVDTAQKAVDAKPGMPLLLEAYDMLGAALTYRAMDDAKALPRAEDAFRKGLELGRDQYPAGRFSLGLVLLRMNRDAEARTELKAYLETQPQGVYAAQAKAFLERPECGRKDCAPDFSVVTTDGSVFDRETLKGKVTLIQFWTVHEYYRDRMWMELRRLAGRMEKEPFQMLGMSAEHDTARAREFIEKNGLTWPQTLYTRNGPYLAFGVTRFPSQVIVDHEGMIVYKALNWSDTRYDELNRAIAKALDNLKKAPKPQPPTGTEAR